MIKYEVMLRKIRRSILNDQIEESNTLKLIEGQIRGIKRATRQNKNQEESLDEISSEEDQKNLTDTKTEVCFDREALKRLKTQRT